MCPQYVRHPSADASTSQGVISANPMSVELMGWPSDSLDDQLIEVPLYALESAESEELDLFEEGVVWEDASYRLSFVVETALPVRFARVSVNDHTELWTRGEWLDSGYVDGRRTYRTLFETDPFRDRASKTPFSLTCGFARVRIRISFRGGGEAVLASQDIVSLDEHKAGSWSFAEEENVRAMYRALFAARDNQAAEWMFQTGPAPRGIARLSDDAFTDWRHSDLSELLACASEVLDLVHDGLEDPEDAFPTPEDVAHGGEGGHEADDVSRLLASIQYWLVGMRSNLRRSMDEISNFMGRMERLIESKARSRGQCQTLPALELQRILLEQEKEWAAEVEEHVERCEFAIEAYEEAGFGVDLNSARACGLPRAEGLYVTDSTYERMYGLMARWLDALAAFGGTEPTFLALRPDRLYEYYVLHRLLSRLYECGFREDLSRGHSIEHFRYSLEGLYTNERRCANTYHLSRTTKRTHACVDLYYQPVIYADSREENGISLHRVAEGGGALVNENCVWTPDFLLVVRRPEREPRVFAIDAKYRALSPNGAKEVLDECVDKYLRRVSATYHGKARTGVRGVWLALGTHGYRKPTVVTIDEEGGSWRCGTVPVCAHAGCDGLATLFTEMGIQPVTASMG